MDQLSVHIGQLRDAYINQPLLCQKCFLDNVPENSFVDCEFPNLIILTLKSASSWSFVRCSFPKLRSVNFMDQSCEEAIFYSCKFNSQMLDHLDKPQYLNYVCNIDREDEYSYLYEMTDEYEWHAQGNIEASSPPTNSYLTDLS